MARFAECAMTLGLFLLNSVLHIARGLLTIMSCMS